MREMIYQHSERYRQLSAPRGPERNVAGEHRALVEAVLNCDAIHAQALVEAHLQATADLLLMAPVLRVK